MAEQDAGCPLCAARDARRPGWVGEMGQGVLIVDPVQRYPFKATLIATEHLPVGAMLDEADELLLALHADVLRAARAVKAASGAARVNLALFANMAPHVHWHLVPRIDDGDTSPPVLTPGDAAPDAMLGARANALRAALGLS